MSGEDDGFGLELAQAVPQHATAGRKRDFAPWHKPRKHWLRRHQWGVEADRLVRELGLASEQRSLSYLSLPGPDMLDVRALGEICKIHGLSLKYLGFMGDTSLAAQTELNISNNEVQSGAFFAADKRSIVRTDPLQRVAIEETVAYSDVRKFAPFDIVNIDLCNGVAGYPPHDQQRGCYDALKRIIDLQRMKRPPEQPWVLFITTRADKGCVDRDAAVQLFQALIDNCQNHPGVDAAALAALKGDKDRLDGFVRGQGLHFDDFEKCFAAAISKWLLVLANSGTPAYVIELLESSAVYSVKSPGVGDMISFGFRVRAVTAVAQDRIGLASQPAANCEVDSEPAAAIALLERLGSVTNVDRILSEGSAYQDEVQRAASVMSSARFDPDAYVDWALSQRENPGNAASQRGRVSAKGGPQVNARNSPKTALAEAYERAQRDRDSRG